jgi:hypothetical protein
MHVKRHKVRLGKRQKNQREEDHAWPAHPQARPQLHVLIRPLSTVNENGRVPRATQEKSIFGAVPGADRYLYEV